jgi:ribosomal protein S4
VLEKQFRRYYEEANRREGKTGDNLLQILESRSTTSIYRAGLARTRRMARQLVNHGHFLVNGVKVNIPSYRVSKWDIIDVKPKSMPPTRSSSPRSWWATARSRRGCRSCPRPCGSSCTSCPSVADRHAGQRAADRRAVLEVADLSKFDAASNSGCRT